MMTCKQVSRLISAGELADAPFARRMAVRLHLAICDKCRVFKRQVEALSRAARTVAARPTDQPPPDFEAKLVQRMRGPKP
jgi:predicted anti-sigma-YlaC factor YlaD